MPGRTADRFTLVVTGIALLLFIVEHINGRFWMNDLRVYYGAGRSLLNGTPLYGVAHGLGTGIFKYAPALAVLYAPLAVLPYGIAASIQYLLITMAFVDGIRRIDRMVREKLLDGRAEASLPLALAALSGAVHLHRELHLGNINMMLLWTLIVALEQLGQGRAARGGLLLGVAMLAKPHMIVLLPLLGMHRRWTTMGAALGTIAMGLLLPATILGWGGNMELHATWAGEMAKHNASLIYTGDDDHRAVNTVYSILHRAVVQHVMGGPGRYEAHIVLLLVALAAGALVRVNKNRGLPNAFAFEYLLLVGLVPSITLTDTEHFLLAIPLATYLIHRLVPRSDPRWLAAIAVPVLLMYGGNFGDAIGGLSGILIQHGVLGIGNLGLLVLTVLMWSGSNHRAVNASH